MRAWTLHSGDCLDPVTGMARLPDKSVDCIFDDPPYSEHVHTRSRRGHTGYSEGQSSRGATFNRTREFGFDPITPEDMEACAQQYARIVRRWVGVFSDTESAHLWREAMERAGLEYVRTAFWHKLGATPQFTGDRPAVAVEAITLCHPPGRKRWNGGGKHGLYAFPIVLNRSHNEPRLSTAQKPIELMMALLRDFADPGELVLDAHAGSGTTLAAAVRLGRDSVGWELDPEEAEKARHRIAGEAAQGCLFEPLVSVGTQAPLFFGETGVGVLRGGLD